MVGEPRAVDSAGAFPGSKRTGPRRKPKHSAFWTVIRAGHQRYLRATSILFTFAWSASMLCSP
jgi:hypothetical protein